MKLIDIFYMAVGWWLTCIYLYIYMNLYADWCEIYNPRAHPLIRKAAEMR